MIWNGEMKSLVGDIHKAYLFADSTLGFKVDLHPEIKKMKFLHVNAEFNDLSLPQINLFQTEILNEDMETAEELVKDTAIFKTLYKEIQDSDHYNVIQFNTQSLELRVNVIHISDWNPRYHTEA